MDGSRTHRGPQRGPPPVLKTGEPTGTLPLPPLSILQRNVFVKSSVQGKTTHSKESLRLTSSISATTFSSQSKARA